ncbi:MAG: DUF6948 domain-containing protein [Planctomycetota bacterium]|jgi:hypothetical protein
MDIESLTIKQLRELQSLIASNKQDDGLNDQVGKYVIIRTYSAGVWFGKLLKKASNEVILTEARRMYYWKCAKSISLSGVAEYGIDQEKSKICVPLDRVWLQAIEILNLSNKAIKSLMECPNVEAE